MLASGAAPSETPPEEIGPPTRAESEAAQSEVTANDPDTKVIVIRTDEHSASCASRDITWQSTPDGTLKVDVDVHDHTMEYAVISGGYRRGRSLGFGGRSLKNGGVR